MERKISWLLLSGLIIGPIMGTGIILLPPIVYRVAVVCALPARVVMIGVSFFFAGILLFSAKPVLAVIMLMAIYVLSCGKIKRKLFSQQNVEYMMSVTTPLRYCSGYFV